MIVIVGLFVARILQRIGASALHAFGVDALSERVGVARYLASPDLSGLIGYLVYIVVLSRYRSRPCNVDRPDVPGAAAVGHAAAGAAGDPEDLRGGRRSGRSPSWWRVIVDLVANLLSAGLRRAGCPAQPGPVSETPAVSPSKLVGHLVAGGRHAVWDPGRGGSRLGWTAMVPSWRPSSGSWRGCSLGLIILVVAMYLANLATSSS